MYFYLLLFIICYLLLIKMNIPGGIIIAACPGCPGSSNIIKEVKKATKKLYLLGWL